MSCSVDALKGKDYLLQRELGCVLQIGASRFSAKKRITTTKVSRESHAITILITSISIGKPSWNLRYSCASL